MNNNHNNEYYNNYYRDYINYLHSTNNIIQQNINLLYNNCYNLYYLNRYYLQHQYNNTNIPNNIHLVNNINEISNNNYNPNNNYSLNNNYNSNSEYYWENINNNNLQNIFNQVFEEIRLMENENIYNYILDNCIRYNKFYEIENPLNDECPINQIEFQENDDVTIINNCNHIFNTEAIKHWFKSNYTCPLCRNNLLENTDYQPQSSYQFRF